MTITSCSKDENVTNTLEFTAGFSTPHENTEIPFSDIPAIASRSGELDKYIADAVAELNQTYGVTKSYTWESSELWGDIETYEQKFLVDANSDKAEAALNECIEKIKQQTEAVDYGQILRTYYFSYSASSKVVTRPVLKEFTGSFYYESCRGEVNKYDQPAAFVDGKITLSLGENDYTGTDAQITAIKAVKSGLTFDYNCKFDLASSSINTADNTITVVTTTPDAFEYISYLVVSTNINKGEALLDLIIYL